MAETFVLVHGSWHGGWGWEQVAARLREQGHTVYTPTLAGHGPGVERAGITHKDCVDTVVNLIEGENLRDVVLVGHSFGGTVISKAVERVPERIKRLVYWVAFVLNDGESLNDNVPEAYVDLFGSLAAASPDNTVMMPWEIWVSAFMQDATEAEAQEIYLKLSPEPYQPFVEKLDLKRFWSLDTPKSVVFCRQDIALPEGYWHPKMSSRLGQYKLVEMDGSHEALFTRPVELADNFIVAAHD